MQRQQGGVQAADNANAGGPESGSMKELVNKLHQTYLKYVKPLEDLYRYDEFRPSWFEETILNQRPLVTFFGPWSSGKTSFVNFLLGKDYLLTGPQPTTDAFTVVVHGDSAGPLDGQVLVSSKDLPFRGLTTFGDGFLKRFQGFQAPHPLLQRVTLVDTPGILEGAKAIRQRGYDYARVARWFAERSDLIFVLFDPSKMDAGAELKMLFMYALHGLEAKVRIVLNKADTVDSQGLLRVYGSLFWNMSNMIRTTEPPRVYIGSFWKKPYKQGSFAPLFTTERAELLRELLEVVPQQAKDRKVASLIRRAKAVLVHALILGTLRANLPVLFGKAKAKAKALQNLDATYAEIGAKYKMNPADFPPVDDYVAFLSSHDIEKFPDLDKAQKAIAAIRGCMDTVLPGLLRPIRSVAANPYDTASRQELLDLYKEHLSVGAAAGDDAEAAAAVVNNSTTSGMTPVAAGSALAAADLGVAKAACLPPSTVLAADALPPTRGEEPSDKRDVTAP